MEILSDGGASGGGFDDYFHDAYVLCSFYAFAVGVASFEIASIVSNVCQFVPKPQQHILQFDTHLPINGISG